MQPTSVEVIPTMNPLSILDKALSSGIDPDKLGRLMDLVSKWTADRAAEAFAGAITEFQRECPPVVKRRRATGKITFDYASYDDVMRAAGPIMARNNIVATYSTEPGEGVINGECRIRVGTHVESTRLTLPVPAGVVNDTQLHGQAVTYLKRQLLCLALNIVVTDEDDDANGCLDTLIRAEQEDLCSAMDAKGMPLAAFLAFAKAENLESIPRKEFARLLNSIKMTKPKKESSK